jgi:uncharacterized phage-associated protein
MTVSAHDIAAELRRRIPGLPVKKLHKLLYLCQGFHLGWFGHPLFREKIAAWDMGPVVAELWKAEQIDEDPPPPTKLGEAELNTIGYVLYRYSDLTGRDLEDLTHGQMAWQEADRRRREGGSDRIELDWMRETFTRADFDEVDPDPDPQELAKLTTGAWERLREGAQVDDMEMIRRRRAARASR